MGGIHRNTLETWLKGTYEGALMTEKEFALLLFDLRGFLFTRGVPCASWRRLLELYSEDQSVEEDIPNPYETRERGEEFS
jgi:hypothetical protein